jgi:hypothetical protein
MSKVIGLRQMPNPSTFKDKAEFMQAMQEYGEWMIEASKQRDEAIARIRKKRADAAVRIFFEWLNPCVDTPYVSLEERGLRADAPDEAKTAYAEFLAIQKKCRESGEGR